VSEPRAGSGFGATQRFATIALACIAAVGLALIGQYAFEMRPCPWCILQRLIFIVIGVVAALGALLGPRLARIGIAGSIGVLAVLGAAAALWQHGVAAKSSSCNLTLADKLLNALGVEALLPSLFQITANCAESAVKVFGVSFEHWSLVLFLILALFSASTALKLTKRA